jgi:hypothetical protein
MITLESCIALCGLTEVEVLAIHEQEHPSEFGTTVVAYVLSQKSGGEKIWVISIDDIRSAELRGDRKHARRLLHGFYHFI